MRIATIGRGVNKRSLIYFGIAVILAVVGLVFITTGQPPETQKFGTGIFDAERAYGDLVLQVDFGPRIRGEAGYDAFADWAEDQFSRSGWQVMIHESEYMGFPFKNIIAGRGNLEGMSEWVVVAAHYDTRIFADRDPVVSNRNLPVPGANDGASGVAVLMELARSLPLLEDKAVWLVLFDAEDNGDIDGRPWIIGSSGFVRDLESLSGGRLPNAVVVIDMVGDAGLNIHIENNSDSELVEAIWAQAMSLGYSHKIIPSRKYSMVDDHLPFLAKDIPAVLLIDFDYPYWHTIEDTPDKTSPESLKAVGETILAWLQR